MKNLPKIAISIGDLNGIGVEIALKSHDTKKRDLPTYILYKSPKCLNKLLCF